MKPAAPKAGTLTPPSESPWSHRPRWGEFVVLPENRAAVVAAQSIAENLWSGRPAPVIPLVLHGSPGTGKTLLCNTLVREACEGSPTITARTIMAGDVRGLGGDGEHEGLADPDLMACDLLVLEDLQHLNSREANRLCRLLDHRLARRRATVVSASVGPAGLRRLPQRLTSRLAGGLVVQLKPLSANSRRVLLEAAAAKAGVRLTPEAIDWLARQATGGGARAALGLLNNLAAVAAAFPGPLSKSAAIDALSHAAPPATGHEVAQIVKRVAAAFGLPAKELMGPSRLRRVMVPRQVAMYLARELSGLSLPRLGSAFGRDHSTVLHACRRVEEELDSDAAFAGLVRQLRDELV